MKRFLPVLFLVVVLIPAIVAAQNVTLSGKITQWKSGKETVLSGARVIIGTDISLNTNGMTDKINNPKGIKADVTTDSNGRYTANLPRGRYAVIVWKSHYVPSSYTASAPGTFNGSISEDNQVGAAGRHMSLQR